MTAYDNDVLQAITDTISFAGESITIGDTQSTDTISASATVANNDTVTVNGRVYTFKTTLTPAVDEIKINGRDGSLTNLESCINGAGSPGVDYGDASSVNPYVTCSDVVVATHVITLTSKIYGTASNLLTLAKSAANLTIGASLFTGGGSVTTCTALVARGRDEFDYTEAGRFEHISFDIKVLASALAGNFVPSPDVLATARGLNLRIGSHGIEIFPGWYAFKLVSRDVPGA